MIQSHFAAVENSILKLAEIQNSAGHSLHKGTPREIFIKNFLSSHLGKTVTFGTGEIIDASSQPNESRNQHDIVIYRNEFPTLDFQGGITGFLAESVLATIEVKSELKFDGLRKSFKAAMNCKKMKRNYHEGLKLWHVPPAIMNFVVAYDGPRNMQTIHAWIKKLEPELNFVNPQMPAEKQDRLKFPSPGIDGIFILGKGFVHFDNFIIDCVHPDTRQRNGWMNWVLLDANNVCLLVLFLNLAQAICSYPQRAVNLIPYLREIDGAKLQWAK